MTKLLKAGIVLSVGFGIFPSLVRSASIDCTKVKSDVEKLICQSDALLDFDRDVSSTYNLLIASMSKIDADSLRQHQRAWIKEREACSEGLDISDHYDFEQVQNCVLNQFESRFEALDEMLHPTKIEFNDKDFLVFHSTEYGFELRYPSSMQITTEFAGYYHLPTDPWRGQSLLPSIPVVAIVHRENSAVEVRIRVHDGKNQDDACLPAQEDSLEFNEEHMIDGHLFEAAHFEGAGMSQYANGVYYQTFSRGRCYFIERFTAGSGLSELSRSGQRQKIEIENAFYGVTEKIVGSFKFTNE